MVEVMPFKGILYNSEKIEDLSKVIAPPYDVISESGQDYYYKLHPNNIIRLILGKKFPDDNENNNRYTRSAEFLKNWLEKGILKPDEKPAFYIYEQYFCLKENVCFNRKGLIALVKLEDIEAKMILGHEKTHSEPKKDRFALMDACKAQFSQIFCFYPDGDSIKEVLERESKGEPIIEARDKDGIVNRLWRINDEKTIEDIKKGMTKKRLFIADGHHRYVTSLAFRDSSKLESAKYTMMYMVEEKDYGLLILPFHRIIYGLENFDQEKFLEELKKHFVVEAKEKTEMLDDMVKRSGHLFGLYFGDNRYFLLTLKDEKILDEINNKKSKELKELDVTILHDLIIKKILGLGEEKVKKLENIKYSMNLDEAIETVKSKQGQILFILNSTKIEQVKKIALKGEKMSQKSTCFYPKISSGLVMRKID